jgi:hypothetical protein
MDIDLKTRNVKVFVGFNSKDTVEISDIYFNDPEMIPTSFTMDFVNYAYNPVSGKEDQAETLEIFIEEKMIREISTELNGLLAFLDGTREGKKKLEKQNSTS